jgi:tRNA(fMet)-specific endonuclease VapC
MTWYLLDTNTASYVIKGKSAAVDRRLLKVPQVAISAVTEGELRYGVARLPDARRLNPLVEAFCAHVTILPWDSEAAREYGPLRATLEREGQQMGNLDLMIGAHAMALGFVLVTHDHAFKRIKKLKVEDWTS